MENELIPANLHFQQNRQGVKALEEGRIIIVAENTPLPDNNGLLGINNFGFGGTNSHVLLRWNLKTKVNRGLPNDDIPRLVTCSGRTKEAVLTIMNYLSNNTLDQELIRLYHQIFSKKFAAHLYRGYTILSKSNEIGRHTDGCLRPKSVYLIFDNYINNWSQWINELKSLPIFLRSIEKIQIVLDGKKFKKTDTHITEDILGSTTLQLALADSLKAVGVKPKGCAGIGLGEFICGYFEGCLTLEQTIDCIFQIALVLAIKDSTRTCFIKTDKVKLEPLPPGIEIIEVHENGATISGEISTLRNFIGNSKYQGVVIQKIENSTIDFQNKNLKNIKPQLLEPILDILNKLTLKKSTWVSRSSHQKLASAEYFLDSLSATDLLSEMKKNIDKDSTIFQIGNGIGMNNLNGLVSFNLDSFRNSNKIVSFLEILGRMYLIGQNLNLALLYPHVEYPVSRGTAMISPSIKFDHSKSWDVMRFEKNEDSLNLSFFTYSLDVNLEQWSYITGHVIDGRNLFPTSGYLSLVWQFFVHKNITMMFSKSIVFENVNFERAITVSKDKKLEFYVAIHQKTGSFEIYENDEKVVSGKVITPENIKDYQVKMPLVEPNNYDMSTDDIYKELRLRGYNYFDGFKALQNYSREVNQALLQWDNNWVTFMENMLQVQILNLDNRNLLIPTFIKQISIDVDLHVECIRKAGEVPLSLPVTYYEDSNIIKSGGIEIRGLRRCFIPRRPPVKEAISEKYLFVPNETNLTLKEAVRVNIQIAIENIPAFKVKIVELIDKTAVSSIPLGPLIKEASLDIPLVQPEVTILCQNPLKVDNCTIIDGKMVTQTGCYLVVGTDLLRRPQIFKEALNALKNDGFIISRQSLEFEASQSDLPNINILTVYRTDSEQLILIRKLEPIPNLISYAIDLSDTENFSWLTELQKQLKTKQHTTLYVQNQIENGILGFINCLRKEADANLFRAVMINDDAPPFKLEEPFYREQLRKGLAINIYKNSKWGTYRHFKLEPVKKIECEHAAVYQTIRGDISSLQWMQGPLRKNISCQSGKVLVNVYYSALNLTDVMDATGRIYLDVNRINLNYLGSEFSGKTKDGTRVMGMCESGAITNLIEASSMFTWTVPNKWSLEKAATIPVIYGTVIYALFIRTNLKRGDSILIHSGSGSFGQAAIRLALYCGCTVFTTVETEEKREFIKKQFPAIKDSQIGNSGDPSFEQMIYRETNGRGVDIVLNTLAGEKRLASIRCLVTGGQFLEIGKFHSQTDHRLNLLFMEKEATFIGIMLDHLMASSYPERQLLYQLMNKGIENGSIQPLKCIVFEDDEIENAFRFMTLGKHMGKVLIKIRNEEVGNMDSPSPKMMLATPRYLCDPNKVIVLIGGLGGFGLELADWLILRNCKKLVLSSRSGVQTGYQTSRIDVWNNYGVEINISTADITTKQGCEQLIAESQKLGSIESIFNLAVVLKDAVLENQTVNKFKSSLAPKAYATKYLDEITRQCCPNLRNFVVFSSVSCGRGNSGQTNYGMSNSIMERICEKRKADGYPAMAIEWCAISVVGVAVDMQKENEILEIEGTVQQPINNCLEKLEMFLNQNETIVSSTVLATKEEIDSEKSNLVETIAGILGIKNLKTVSLHSPLAQLGMDSITAVEIRHTVKRKFEMLLSVQDIRSLTFAKIQEIQDNLCEQVS